MAMILTPVEEKVTPDSFGGNFETHSNATSEEISEFQSLVKPILKEQIPYLQATEGLELPRCFDGSVQT